MADRQEWKEQRNLNFFFAQYDEKHFYNLSLKK